MEVNIFTESGIKKINDIENGEKIYDNNCKLIKVIKKIKLNTNNDKLITLNNGTQIRLNNESFLTLNNGKHIKIKELKIGDYLKTGKSLIKKNHKLKLPKYFSINNKKFKITKEMMCCYGLILSNDISDLNNDSMYSNIINLNKIPVDNLCDIIIKFKKSLKLKENQMRLHINQNDTNLIFYNNIFNDLFLSYMNIGFSKNKNASFLFRCTSDMVMEAMNYIFNETKENYIFKSDNNKLLIQLQALLSIKLSIKSNIISDENNQNSIIILKDDFKNQSNYLFIKNIETIEDDLETYKIITNNKKYITNSGIIISD